MNNSLLPRLFILAALIPLAAGCARNTAPVSTPTTVVTPAKPAAAPIKPIKPAPPAPVLSTPGAAVTIGENENNKTVRLRVGETLAVRLAVDESTGNRWFMLNRLEGGILDKKGNTTYAQTPGGNVATLLYTGLKAGTQELHFYYAPPEARQNATRAGDFRVIVR